MKKIRIETTAIPAAAAAAALFLASCAGAPVPETLPAPGRAEAGLPAESFPEKPSAEAAPESAGGKTPPPESGAVAPVVRFVQRTSEAELPDAPQSIGSWSPGAALPPARKSFLTAAFREAYREALLRGIALTGALGGDLAHLWAPPARRTSRTPVPESPGAVAQNWRDPSAAAGSWGIDALVLACVPLEGDRAFVVRGDILDAYGKGNGVGGANGVAGYGAPLGDEFPYKGGRAQRFEFGLILLNAEMGIASFSREDPPSKAGVPETVGKIAAETDPAKGRFGAAERAAFRSAWAAAVNSGRSPSEPDGPVESLAGADGGFWLQTFGGASWALSLSDGRPKIVDGIFVDAVRRGFGEYGEPVTDSYVRGGRMTLETVKGRLEAGEGR